MSAMDETTSTPITNEGAPATNGASLKDQAVNGNVRTQILPFRSHADEVQFDSSIQSTDLN